MQQKIIILDFSIIASITGFQSNVELLAPFTSALAYELAVKINNNTNTLFNILSIKCCLWHLNVDC